MTKLLAALSDDQSSADSFDEDASWLEDELISGHLRPHLHHAVARSLYGNPDAFTIELREDELVARAVEVADAYLREISEFV